MHELVNAFYKGRAVLKKGQGAYFDNLDKPKKACFIGAMYYGLYKKTTENTIGLPMEIAVDYPQLREFSNKPAPCGHDEEGGIISAILIHLNDEHTGHDWPDKKIADWLESALKDAV